MKQLHIYFTKKGLVILLAFIMAIVLCFVRTKFFTINSDTLNQAAKTNEVSFKQSAHSFDIIPVSHFNHKDAIIFYPGALVDSRAYAPKLANLANATGMQIFIIKPYLRLAVLNTNAAAAIIEANPSIKNWYIGGHSMGGGAACNFIRSHPIQTKGLFLLAAYCSPKGIQFSGPTLAIVGTNDLLEPFSKIKKQLPANSKIFQIAGANHASFGNYGNQPFDGKQTISELDMTEALTRALSNFIKSLN